MPLHIGNYLIFLGGTWRGLVPCSLYWGFRATAERYGYSTSTPDRMQGSALVQLLLSHHASMRLCCPDPVIVKMEVLP